MMLSVLAIDEHKQIIALYLLFRFTKWNNTNIYIVISCRKISKMVVLNLASACL